MSLTASTSSLLPSTRTYEELQPAFERAQLHLSQLPHSLDHHTFLELTTLKSIALHGPKPISSRPTSSLSEIEEYEAWKELGRAPRFNGKNGRLAAMEAFLACADSVGYRELNVGQGGMMGLAEGGSLPEEEEGEKNEEGLNEEDYAALDESDEEENGAVSLPEPSLTGEGAEQSAMLTLCQNKSSFHFFLSDQIRQFIDLLWKVMHPL